MPSFTLKAALVAAIAQIVSAHPHAINFKRENGLAVELTDAGAAGVGMKVTNTGGEALNLLTYATLLDEGPVNKLRVTKDGEVMPFTGVVFNYDLASIPDEKFWALAPGESTETVVDVASLYALEGGVYTISASDVVEYAELNSTEIAGVIPYESNELEVEITAEEIAQHSRAVASLDKRTEVSQCSGSEGAALEAAIEYTVGLATNAATAASSGSSSKFQEYFRTTSSSTRSNVASRFRAIAQEASSLTSGNTQYFCGDVLGACQQGVIAYTQPASNIIANCELFYSLPATSRGCGDQSQAATVLHEFTHAPGIFPPGTEDFAYGYAAATRLSSTQAVNNADNYALFADAIDNNC
ncbi:uncharacterized protein HMPREF1541_00635 [Cyphellophora europaea CBS 101466]|uniref:Neutral protease 2 n=1 Tax=Cyphellophora europaea (strain CBS 101466) TaxID=1220924 RepID=W2SCL3_CYPE1|nr:uncharacterized protein HMPREF1541_00635 [Cyphellophora europaea CBS 101466]ETN46451.1 hypothetical protein HMPREF1541_00635 [Cyphellophora europaea CBS 101466]